MSLQIEGCAYKTPHPYKSGTPQFLANVDKWKGIYGNKANTWLSSRFGLWPTLLWSAVQFSLYFWICGGRAQASAAHRCTPPRPGPNPSAPALPWCRLKLVSRAQQHKVGHTQRSDCARRKRTPRQDGGKGRGRERKGGVYSSLRPDDLL